jgi:esterase/lipase
MHIFDSFFLKLSWWSVKKSTYLIWLMILGAILLITLAATLYIRSLPALDIWHTTILKNEFTSNSNVKDFKSYLALEEKLFEELDQEIIAKLPKEKQSKINRYTKNSLSNPSRWSQNWNMSFEIPTDDPKMGVLLIHGMSDSPYSLHTQAEYLHDKGVYVVGVRLPGHGTIPSGLIDVTWQDMATVVKMGMLHLKEKVGNNPIQIIGYSTGASLALHYTFTALKDTTLPVPSNLVFYSPAIGVSAAAKFAVVQRWAATLLNSDKLEWNSVMPEYDPFKYGSFSINAAYQVHDLAKEVQKEFDGFHANPKANFPPVLTFASIVDATILAEDIITGLYNRLPKENNTLIFFDINNKFSQNLLINAPSLKTIHTIRTTPIQSNYSFELISDLNSSEEKIQRRQEKYVEDMNITWPMGIYSLSHVAMPFSKNDPLYGDVNAPKSPGIQLGYLAGYGERMVLQISPSALLRQRWNPFHKYTKKRVLEFMGL